MRAAPTDTESETGGGVSITVQDLWRGDSIQVYPAGSGSGPDVVAFWPGPGTWKAEIRLTSGTTAGAVELFTILSASSATARPEQTVPISEIFWGGNSAFTIDYRTQTKTDGNLDAMFFDCAFRFAQKPIVYCLGESYVVLKRCDVTDSTEDGIDARIRAVVLEDNCTVGYVGINGVADRRFVQCSTGHIGARMIRVGGEYKFSGGPLIQDVMYDDDLFSYGLILGSHLHQSLGQTSPSFRRYAIAVGSAELDFSELWTIEPRFASRFGSVSADTKYCRLDEDATSWQCVSPPSWSVAIVSGGTATFKAIPNFAGLVFSKDVFPSLLPLAGESL